MSQLSSQLSAQSQEYQSNFRAMEKTVADFKDKLAVIQQGGDENARASIWRGGKCCPATA
jgi:hypothetical protein